MYSAFGMNFQYRLSFFVLVVSARRNGLEVSIFAQLPEWSPQTSGVFRMNVVIFEIRSSNRARQINLSDQGANRD